MTFVAILFGLTYVCLLLFQKHRWKIALASAALFVILGYLPLGKILSSIDFNVLMMIGGTMGLVALFIDSGMPARMADLLICRTPDVRWAVVALSVFAGVISAFIDNVATVLMVAPVALEIAKRLKISPVGPIIAVAVSSNLQGAATLVGDTTSILLGSYAGMDFLDFFWFMGRPGIFWTVELGALIAAVALLILFRKEKQSIDICSVQVVKNHLPSYMLLAMVALLILASFIPNKPSITNGVICVTLCMTCAMIEALRYHDADRILKPFREMDYETILLLAGLFVVIGGITEAGLVDAIAELFVKLGGDNIFIIYTIIVWASVVFSAFIDNIPYVATMLPVVQGMASALGVEPYLLYFGLLVGATLGGNLTPIGASANITAIGILRKNGYEVSTREYARIGMPLSLTAVLSGYLFIWFLWA
ncbi:MAG TPA: SLC13 family permease [Oscillospiraceae bacterium]|nr:SLC13 family permease [Oscillospiraceae bacterium]HRW57779.1 SLC13 family permease [Oscillospiraceae bacterium]